MCLIRNECRSNDEAEGIKYDFMIQKKNGFRYFDINDNNWAG